MASTPSKDLLKRTYVFLGPSYPVEKAKEILDVNYLGPVAQGDILGLLYREPKVIVIIDGYFNRVPAVWHKELLLVLEQGIKVFGSSSMGALRAAELSPFGMIGYGQIYNWYQDGVIDGDDEVAIFHSSAQDNYRSLSLPLVNIRATLIAAQKEGLISAVQSDQLLKLAKNIYYPDRNMRSWLAAAKTAGLEFSPEFQQFCAHGGVDQKALDAEGCLKFVYQKLCHFTPPGPPAFKTSETGYVRALIGDDISLKPGGGGLVTARSIHENDRLSGHFPELNILAQRDLLLEKAASLLKWEVSAEEISQEAEKFWHEHNIHSPFAMREWLKVNYCSFGRLEAILKRRIYLRKFVSICDLPVPYYYLDILRQNGELPYLIEKTEQLESNWQCRKGQYLPDEFNDKQWELILQYARKAVRDEDQRENLESIAAKLTFKDVMDLIRQILREHGAEIMALSE